MSPARLSIYFDVNTLCHASMRCNDSSAYHNSHYAHFPSELIMPQQRLRPLTITIIDTHMLSHINRFITTGQHRRITTTPPWESFIRRYLLFASHYIHAESIDYYFSTHEPLRSQRRRWLSISPLRCVLPYQLHILEALIISQK